MPIPAKIVILNPIHSAVSVIIVNTFSTSLAVFQSNRIFFTPVVRVWSQSLRFYGKYEALQKA